VTDETLIFALYRPSSKIPGGWAGDELDFARAKAERAAGVRQGKFNPLLAKSRKPYYPARCAADKHWLTTKGPLTQPCVTKQLSSMTDSNMPAYPFTAARNASDATQFDPKASNGTYCVALAKSKHPEKALHIALLALAGTVQRLHIAHYAHGGVVPPTAADISTWISGGGVPPAHVDPDAELTAILARLAAAITASCQRCKITVAAERTQHRLSLLIDANQLLTLSLIEGCSQHELLQHVASLPAAVHNCETFGYLSIEEVTGAQLLMMSYFDLYNSAFRSVQSRVSFVAEAGVKKFDPPDLTLTFQQHRDLTRK